MRPNQILRIVRVLRVILSIRVIVRSLAIGRLKRHPCNPPARVYCILRRFRPKRVVADARRRQPHGAISRLARDEICVIIRNLRIVRALAKSRLRLLNYRALIINGHEHS